MRLYLLRHAHAEETAGLDDHHRALTAEGQQYAERVAQALAGLGVRPAKLYSSPRVRAQQTADAVSVALQIPVEVRDEVNFGFNLRALQTLINGLGLHDEVIFVGHEPSLSTAINDLTGGRVEMKKAGLARIDLTQFSPPRGELIWLLAPRIYDLLEDR